VPKLPVVTNDEALAQVAEMRRRGRTEAETCRALRISRATYYRALRKIKAAERSALERAS
jgi:DNA invertase Pin-like site-specific DNA recombinase